MPYATAHCPRSFRSFSGYLLAALLASLVICARADTVVLENGKAIEGARFSLDGGQMLLSHQGALLRLPLERVRRIVTSDPRSGRGDFSDGAPGAAVASLGTSPARAAVAATRERVVKSHPEAGRIVLKQTANGDYFRYIPRHLTHPVRVAFLFHGTPEPDETAIDVAGNLIRRSHWVPLAEAQGVVLCSIAFDDQRYFGSRYLEGNLMPADVFVLDLYQQLDRELGGVEPRFYLYGHSAGAQFVSRFALKYPEHVASAVVSAAGSFAYPDPTLAWPFGMLDAPNPQGFVDAAAVPMTVVVGSNDVEPVPLADIQRGPNRIARAEAWVDAMRELAESHGKVPGVKLVLVEGLDHTSSLLSTEAVRYLFR